jgi:uncharacterized membrane protein YfcA
MAEPWTTAAITIVFVIAGTVKGLAGMGLPTVAMGLLGLLMPPAEAAALLIAPSLVTNLWQFAAGPSPAALLRRSWPMLLAILLATWASAGLIAGAAAGRATLALGAALMLYAALGLAKWRLAVAPRAEPWLAPLVGAATGVVTGATGVFVIPAVPYLQALGLEKDELVQALGLSFTVSTVALALGLAGSDAFHLAAGGASLLCILPALLGMAAGQRLRARIDGAAFRRLFFVALLILGAALAFRGPA